MYSNSSDYDDYGQKRPYGGQQSRAWDEEAKREEWPESPRNSVRDPYNNYNDNNYNQYNEDGNNRAQSRNSRGQGKTYMRMNISDNDWRRKGTTSTERTFSEKKRRTFGDDDQHRYQPESGDSYRQSPEESGGYSQRQDDFHYSQYKEESHYRPPVAESWDRDGPERKWSQDGTHSRDVFEKSYSPPRPKSGSFSRDHEDHNHNRTMFPRNGSNRQTEPSRRRLSPPPPIPPPPPPATKEKKMSKGFQRFLNVLNMGVNVETLTKIVNQGSPDVNVRQPSPPSPYGDRPWTVESSHRPQFWPETERTPKSPFSPPSRSYSSNGKTMSEERFVESRQFERKNLENRSASPARKSSSFEDDNKRRQMHDVLQAIGIKLEFEEVGQMSSRIHERLYGKTQIEHVPIHKEEQEMERRRGACVPKRRRRSSSESSSGSFKDYRKSHSYSSQKEETDFSYYADTKHPDQMVSPNTYARPNPELPQAPVIPPHGSTIGFTNAPTNLPPMFIPPVPQYHPTYPQTGPPFPPMNIFPAVGPPNTSVPPPPLCMPHPFFRDLLIPTKQLHVDTNAQKTNNKQQNQKRPRCLQVISTKK